MGPGSVAVAGGPSVASALREHGNQDRTYGALVEIAQVAEDCGLSVLQADACNPGRAEGTPELTAVDRPEQALQIFGAELGEALTRPDHRDRGPTASTRLRRTTRSPNRQSSSQAAAAAFVPSTPDDAVQPGSVVADTSPRTS